LEVHLAKQLFGEGADEFLGLCGADSGDLEDIVKRASVSSIEYGIRIAGQANISTGANMPMYYYNFDAEIPGWDNPGTFHFCRWAIKQRLKGCKKQLDII